MIKSESVVILTKALIAAKRKFAPILKEKENPGFKRDGKNSKYADLAAAIEATEPALLENGLIISQFPHNEGERIGALTILLHESGEFMQDTFTLPISKQDAQTGVAAVTYARRTGYLAILGVAAEDDDGNAAAGNTAGGQTTSTARPTNPPLAKATQPPKAEIPNGPVLATNSTTVTSAPSITAGPVTFIEIPLTEDDLVGFRNRFKLLGDDLASAGLKARRGLPINRLVLAYLLKTTRAPAADKINRAQWNTFFQITDVVKSSEGGIKELVRFVNEATEEKKQ